MLMDLTVVYLFVPFWISIFAFFWNDINQRYVWTQSFIGDALVLSMVFVLVAIPLYYLRLQASNPSHFLHRFRVETSEIFMEETRSQPLPSVFDSDSFILGGMILSYSLWNPFQVLQFSEIPFLTLYSQSFVVLAVWDAGFYWVHRTFHHPKWYKYHKIHHEVRNTTAFSSHHSGVVDKIISILPLYLVPVIYQLCGTAMVHEVWIMGSAFILAQQYVIHCDLYLFSARWSLGLFWGDVAIHHSNHHFKNQGNFGNVSPLIWDWICNTRYQPRGHQQ